MTECGATSAAGKLEGSSAQGVSATGGALGCSREEGPLCGVAVRSWWGAMVCTPRWSLGSSQARPSSVRIRLRRQRRMTSRPTRWLAATPGGEGARFCLRLQSKGGAIASVELLVRRPAELKRSMCAELRTPWKFRAASSYTAVPQGRLRKFHVSRQGRATGCSMACNELPIEAVTGDGILSCVTVGGGVGAVPNDIEILGGVG